jgi:hypothetical protein
MGKHIKSGKMIKERAKRFLKNARAIGRFQFTMSTIEQIHFS